MANIPVVYPYERDELLYSWQRRLATANGFDSIEEFAQVFIYPYTESRKRLLERKVYPDGREDFLYFAKCLGISQLQEQAQLYVDTTLFPVAAPFMSRLQQLQLAKTAKKNEKSMSRRVRSKRVFNDLFYCPICRAEDETRLGFSYLHRIHQVPGITICPTHGVPLVDNSGIEQSVTDLKMQITAAQVTQELLNSNLSISWEYICSLLQERLGKTTSTISKTLNDTGLSHLFSPSFAVSLSKSVNSIPIMDGVFAILFSFGSLEALKRGLPPQKKELSDLVIDLWNAPDVFLDTPTLPRNGLSSDYFKNEVKALVGDEYEILDFQNGKVTMIHHLCENKQTFRANDFLHGRRCKICSQTIFDDKFAEIIDKQSCGRYKYIGRDGINLVLIWDTQEMRALCYSKEFVLQELFRPTCSEIFPCKHPQLEPEIFYTKEQQAMNWIKQHCGDDYCVSLKDINLAGWTYQETKRAVQSLVEGGMLTRIGTGRYRITATIVPGQEIAHPITNQERVWQWIQTHFEKKDIIHTKDLKFDDISNGSMKHIIRWMIDTGRLKRICVGEYQIGDIESHD